MFDADDIPPLEDIPINRTATKQVSTPVVKHVETQPKEKTVPEKSFAGMKKGFLNSSSTSKSTSKSNELIEISSKKSEQTKDFRVFDEVQQVIKEEQQSKNSWLTNDLLKQIEDDESLSQYFSNPYFMEAITLFQHKPQEALAKYGHNAEVMKFFDRMAKILGTHFTSIVDKEEKQKKPNVDPEVNKLLQDEQVRQLLLDPDVVQLMKMLREEPDKAQRMMRTADISMRIKIQRLVDLGLLSVA
ncbi:unnamed protein product [Rotaria sordida]|uniref:STI1/HOP DP domain-containing protein n=1 Tax=Rotaria sordida TaxID=392033 RepID=A0A814AUW2_9BILA|nr:unnamed protein product [Rotaria sordida]CAF0919971.1 unnamed protein product [Rotaria sordida]CAF3493038.1 unnamed protein product [Rotaria sordida]CAF3544231.1 unnamed protein product [Rotaria sordida]